MGAAKKLYRVYYNTFSDELHLKVVEALRKELGAEVIVHESKILPEFRFVEALKPEPGLEEKIRNLMCPFCDNERKFSSPSGLISHVTRMHTFDSCPLCNYKGNLVHHFRSMPDRAHQILWAIFTTFGGRKRGNRIKEIRSSLWEFL